MKAFLQRVSFTQMHKAGRLCMPAQGFTIISWTRNAVIGISTGFDSSAKIYGHSRSSHDKIQKKQSVWRMLI